MTALALASACDDKAGAVFLGDSITAALDVQAVEAGALNFGVWGETTEGLGRRMPHATANASRIYLMIGANDLRLGRKPSFDRILAQLPLDKPLIWSGVMPNYTGFDPGPTNREIQRLCAIRPSCTYIDTQAALAPLGEAAFRDGLHPTRAGYAAWIRALRDADHSTATR